MELARRKITLLPLEMSGRLDKRWIDYDQPGTSAMALSAPPTVPPAVALDDGDGLQRLRVKLWLIWATIVTVLITAWLISLGPVPGILGVIVAKHVLVALLVMGLEINGPPS